MSNLLAARSQMAMSLAFHIIFAALGMAMPVLMLIAEGRWLRTRDPLWLDLVKRWTRATAILFAVGAVSGTVLSFELGLLWPTFMEFAGPIIGMPFSFEGFAFFTEAIFLGIVLYGRGRVSDAVHWLACLVVAVSGAASGFFVVTANAWMNTPAGFVRSGMWWVGDVDPWAAMFNPGWLAESLHMLIAAYLATAASVCGVHAWRLLRGGARRTPPQSEAGRRAGGALDRRALSVALPVLCATALLQPLSGDLSARLVARTQPAKLAAMEGQFRTERGAPLRIGGVPDPVARETRYAIEVPGGLSWLAYGDADAEVRGLNDFPRQDRPNTVLVHLAFQVMVACGAILAAVSLVAALAAWARRGLPEGRWVLRGLAFAGPLGFIAIESGWVVTEVGRQPWIIQGVLRTKDAVTPMPGLVVPFTAFTAVYLLLATVVVSLLRHQVSQIDAEGTADARR